MASQTFYRHTGGADTLSCTVFDNGDWELFKGTKSLAHKATRITDGKRPISRAAMQHIADDKFDKYLRGERIK